MRSDKHDMQKARRVFRPGFSRLRFLARVALQVKQIFRLEIFRLVLVAPLRIGSQDPGAGAASAFSMAGRKACSKFSGVIGPTNL